MKQNNRHLQSFGREKACKNSFIKISVWILIFSITLSLHGIETAAWTQDGLCEHHPEHTNDCGYTLSGGGSCEFNCEICRNEKTSDIVSSVSSWNWNSEYLEFDESAGLWGLGLPGANEGNKVTPEILSEFLPLEITAMLADGSEVTIPVTWDYSSLPAGGGAEGSYMLTAVLPAGYALADDAQKLSVLLELGGDEAGLLDDIPKFVSNWSYVSGGGIEISEDSDYNYSMDYYLPMTSDRSVLIKKMQAALPKQILCQGYNTDHQLEAAGFTPLEIPATTGFISGYVEIKWENIEDVINSAGKISDNSSLTFEAGPVSKPGYLIRVNSNNGSLPEAANDTAEIHGILNLTVTLHDIHLENHTVPSVNPLNTTVNLFDYWVDTDGAAGNDILDKSEKHNGAPGSGVVDVPRTGEDDWKKGINAGHLLLFGDGNIHAGFWNKGAGASSAYGKNAAGMTGIIENTLKDGYPVIKEEKLSEQIDNYSGITDWKLCGDHIGDKTDQRFESLNPQNISDTVISQWNGDTSLDYLFDPDKKQDYKRVYENVTGLFQLDNNGYYYYDMRLNFAEYNKEDNQFVLYDAPAVERTDANYNNDSGDFDGTRSIGNFFPFNTGEQVFDVIENGKLHSSEGIKSHNGKTQTNEYMNHHLGMTVNIDFRQPLNGRLNTGTKTNVPMTFQFSGDDDVWIFIDDVLVLDLGGIHSEIYGTIDFETGEIAIGQSWKSNGFPYKDDGTVDVDALPAPVLETTLREQFRIAGKEADTKWSSDAGNTFASNTSHTLKMFYLERGNYDSSLALRFNLQPLLYQQIKKVDQQGKPVENVMFDLYPAEVTTQNAKGAIECFYTDNDIATQDEFYVKRTEGADRLVRLVTKEDGTSQFLDDDGNYFNFADRGKQYYVLKESKTLEGYRSLPVDIVLYYDPDISMLSVANRWTTGAYACSVVNIIGAGGLTYGKFDEQSGDIVQDPNSASLGADRQRGGLAVAVPLLKRQSDNIWEALYGSNLNGFTASPIDAGADETAWKEAVLYVALEQMADTTNPQWHLSWDTENRRLAGILNDLPGLANRYLINNAQGDMRMVYGMIEPEVLQKLGIKGKTARERYEAFGEYVRAHGTDNTLAAIMGVTVNNSGDNSGFRFLNANQFNRDFRSLIYIPNEQRELWVMKIDQNGKPRNGTRFGLYDNEKCSGKPVAEGVTATVNKQEGTLIFSPSSDTSPGHARIMWASQRRTHYYLKELSAPEDCTLNTTVVPVVVGTYSIYADAGTKGDGVSVMAGVGRLTQTMRQYAMGNDVDITLRDITAIAQYQPSSNTDVLNEDWQDVSLKGTSDALRSMNLHFGKNAVVDYGLHDEDGGALYKPFFVSDTGFIRARVKQNYEALVTPMYEGSENDVNKDNLGDTDLTNLFSLLNIVVVTDETKQDTDTGKLVISKMLSGPELSETDYTENFNFKLQLTDEKGRDLAGEYYFYGTDKFGYVSSGMTLPLHHDESITILGLPDGTKYSVTEISEPGWYPLPKTGTVNKEIAMNKTSFAAFYNSKEAWPDIGFLILHKTVAGGGDRTKEFTFQLTFTDENGKELEDVFSYTGDREGTVSSGENITLGHDEDVTVFGIPAGTHYMVSEKEADQDGYITTFLEENGVIEDGEEYAAAYTNYKERKNPPGDNQGSGLESDSSGSQARSNVPDTGDFLKLWGILSVMFLSIYAAAIYAYRRYRR